MSLFAGSARDSRRTSLWADDGQRVTGFLPAFPALIFLKIVMYTKY